MGPSGWKFRIDASEGEQRSIRRSRVSSIRARTVIRNRRGDTRTTHARAHNSELPMPISRGDSPTSESAC